MMEKILELMINDPKQFNETRYKSEWPELYIRGKRNLRLKDLSLKNVVFESCNSGQFEFCYYGQFNSCYYGQFNSCYYGQFKSCDNGQFESCNYGQFNSCNYGQFNSCENGQFESCENGQFNFSQFPSIRLLSSIPLGELSDGLALELLRRDCYAHPHPDRFDEWVKTGTCPYVNEEYFWHFDWNSAKHLWQPGNPTMRDSDLILAICKEKGWEIKGYLELKEYV